MRKVSHPTELEMHRADYQTVKAAGFESPGELLAAYKRLVGGKKRSFTHRKQRCKSA